MNTNDEAARVLGKILVHAQQTAIDNGGDFTRGYRTDGLGQLFNEAAEAMNLRPARLQPISDDLLMAFQGCEFDKVLPLYTEIGHCGGMEWIAIIDDKRCQIHGHATVYGEFDDACWSIEGPRAMTRAVLEAFLAGGGEPRSDTLEAFGFQQVCG